jgi:hypothetical protein
MATHALPETLCLCDLACPQLVLIYNATASYDPSLPLPPMLPVPQPHSSPAAITKTLDCARRTLNWISNRAMPRAAPPPQDTAHHHQGAMAWLPNLRHRWRHGHKHQGPTASSVSESHTKTASAQHSLPGEVRGASRHVEQQQGCEVLDDCVQLGRDALLPPLDLVPASVRHPQPSMYSSSTFSGTRASSKFYI